MSNTFHLSLDVPDLDGAVAFYTELFGQEPAKRKPGYAKFELADPPVIFSLNVGGTPGTLSHLGIRYPETGSVTSELVRAKNAELEPFRQEGTTCCYAKADKYWVKDTDGVPWEMYTLLADVEAETAADANLRAFLQQGTDGQCCVPGEMP